MFQNREHARKHPVPPHLLFYSVTWASAGWGLTPVWGGMESKVLAERAGLPICKQLLSLTCSPSMGVGRHLCHVTTGISWADTITPLWLISSVTVVQCGCLGCSLVCPILVDFVIGNLLESVHQTRHTSSLNIPSGELSKSNPESRMLMADAFLHFLLKIVLVQTKNSVTVGSDRWPLLTWLPTLPNSEKGLQNRISPRTWITLFISSDMQLRRWTLISASALSHHICACASGDSWK